MLVDDNALEQRSAALDIAPGLHLCERRMLVRTHRQTLAANSAQPARELRGSINIDTHRKRVDQNTDHIVGAGNTGPSARAGCAEHDVPLTAESAEQERSEEHTSELQSP